LKVDAKVWDMKNGKITAVKIDDYIFYCNGTSSADIGRPTAFGKWLKDRKGVFSLNDFFKVHPSIKYRCEALDRELSKLCTNGDLIQLENDKFKIVMR